MQITNLATVSVDTTAGGTIILTLAQAQSATAAGMNALVINPSVEIALVDSGGSSPASPVTGAVVGTYANSPFICPAGVSTVVQHRSGLVRAISSAGTSTVKVGVGCAP